MKIQICASQINKYRKKIEDFIKIQVFVTKSESTQFVNIQSIFVGKNESFQQNYCVCVCVLNFLVFDLVNDDNNLYIFQTAILNINTAQYHAHKKHFSEELMLIIFNCTEMTLDAIIRFSVFFPSNLSGTKSFAHSGCVVHAHAQVSVHFMSDTLFP